MLSDQRVKPGDALQALRQPGTREPATVHVHDFEVVMILSPIVSNEQHE